MSLDAPSPAFLHHNQALSVDQAVCWVQHLIDQYTTNLRTFTPCALDFAVVHDYLDQLDVLARYVATLEQLLCRICFCLPHDVVRTVVAIVVATHYQRSLLGDGSVPETARYVFEPSIIASMTRYLARVAEHLAITDQWVDTVQFATYRRALESVLENMRLSFLQFASTPSTADCSAPGCAPDPNLQAVISTLSVGDWMRTSGLPAADSEILWRNFHPLALSDCPPYTSPEVYACHGAPESLASTTVYSSSGSPGPPGKGKKRAREEDAPSLPLPCLTVPDLPHTIPEAAERGRDPNSSGSGSRPRPRCASVLPPLPSSSSIHDRPAPSDGPPPRKRRRDGPPPPASQTRRLRPVEHARISARSPGGDPSRPTTPDASIPFGDTPDASLSSPGPRPVPSPLRVPASPSPPVPTSREGPDAHSDAEEESRRSADPGACLRAAVRAHSKRAHPSVSVRRARARARDPRIVRWLAEVGRVGASGASARAASCCGCWGDAELLPVPVPALSVVRSGGGGGGGYDGAEGAEGAEAESCAGRAGSCGTAVAGSGGAGTARGRRRCFEGLLRTIRHVLFS